MTQQQKEKKAGLSSLSVQQQQNRIRFNFALVLPLFSLFPLSFYYQPTILTPTIQETNIETKLTHLCKWELLLAFCLLAHIQMVASYRFQNSDAIDGNFQTGGSAQLRMLCAILQNTFEQTLIAIIVHTAWAIILPIEYLVVLPIGIIFFLVGRLIFRVGYSHGAPARSSGVILTMMSSAFMALFLVGWVLYPKLRGYVF